MKLIAETAWHHDGDETFFYHLIKELSEKTNTDYIKLHLLLDIDEYMTKDHPAHGFLKKRMFSRSFWADIISIIQKRNKEIMLLLNDSAAVEFGMKYEPELVEIHSVCLNDYHLLKNLKERIQDSTKIVLGVGGSTLPEIEQAVKILDTNRIILMHGFQNYPTRLEDINFNKMKKIMHAYPQFEHGYADHTAWNHADNTLITLFGAALGMDYIEKHVTTAYGEERLDFQASVSIEMFNDLAEKLILLEKSMGNGILNLNQGEKEYAKYGPNKKAAIIINDMQKGDKLSFESIAFKRTEVETDLSQLDIINAIGISVKKDLKAGHCLTKSDLQD